MARITAQADSAPSARPPPAWITTSSAAWRGSGIWPEAKASKAVNTTIPMPSLNSASPFSTVCRVGLRCPRFTVASTAIGSVGLIRAPNTSAHGKVSSRPSDRAMAQRPTPTITVDASTPSVASVQTAMRRRRSSGRSTCMAPANSRKASM